MQRRLLPQPKDLLLVPVLHALPQLEIKPPQQQRENEPHLEEREVAADAVAAPVREGLVRVAAVGVEGRGGGGVFGGEPARGVEGCGGVEVEGRVVGCELVDADAGLWV